VCLCVCVCVRACRSGHGTSVMAVMKVALASRQEEGTKKDEEEEFGGRGGVLEEHKRCLTLGLWLRKLATTQTPSRFAPFN
jgi:hypothetical protein